MMMSMATDKSDTDTNMLEEEGDGSDELTRMAEKQDEQLFAQQFMEEIKQLRLGQPQNEFFQNAHTGGGTSYYSEQNVFGNQRKFADDAKRFLTETIDNKGYLILKNNLNHLL